MRPPRRGGRRFTVVLTATLAVSGVGVSTAPLALAEPASDPAVVGSWSEPFEEGGSETPRCEYIENFSPNDERRRLQCKPTAVTTAVLPDGRYLYVNGIEGEENAEEGAANSLSPEAEDGMSRVLDVRDGTPSWTTPEEEFGAGTNDVIVEGRTSDDCLSEHPAGVAGVPGRAGDGFVGNLASQLGVPEQEPTCAPDDVAENDVDIFCGDIAQLHDGRQMVIGGTDWYNEPSVLEKADGDPVNIGVVELEGLRQARMFDWRLNDGEGDWRETDDMKYGRWYPANVALPNGDMMAFGGTTKLVKSTQLSQVTQPEVWDADTETWSEAGAGSAAAQKTLPQNPRIYIAPNGKPFYTGHGQMWGPFGQAIDEIKFFDQAFFNTETNSWENTGTIVSRSSPATFILPMEAPYDEMKVMAVGGTLLPPPGSYFAVGTSDITTVHADGTVTNEKGPSAIHNRWFGNAIPLPTGQVLITHGAKNDEVIVPGIEIPVPQPELFDPDTMTFTEMATPERERTYHNSGSLLPNGQVIVGGHSPISTGYGVERDVAVPPFTANNDKDSSFELFSPPYLHKGERPSIDYAPAGLTWDETFEIETEEASEIERVVLMRTPSIQHVFDSDARTLILDFEQVDDNTLSATVPGKNVAIGGYYYLFINRADGSSEVVELDGDELAAGEDEGEDDGKGKGKGKGKGEGYGEGEGEGNAATPASELVPSTARMIHISESSDSSDAPEPMPSTDFEGNGAAPLEHNTFLNNPPNPLEEPDIPGQGEFQGLVPEGLPSAETQNDAPAAPELPTAPGLPEAVTPELPLGGAQGRRGCRTRRRLRPVG
jgi:hypothetical protein